MAFLGEEMKNGEEIVITAEAKAENGGHLTGAYRTLKPAGLSSTRAPGFNTRKEIIEQTLTLNLLQLLLAVVTYRATVYHQSSDNDICAKQKSDGFGVNEKH